MTLLQQQQLNKSYVYPDGSCITPTPWGRWKAFWADRTPLRGDNDQTSYFDRAEEAAQALADGGEGPAADQKLTLVLTVEVTYQIPDLSPKTIQSVHAMLEHLPQLAAGEGWFTGETPATVVAWSSTVTEKKGA